MYPKMKVEVTKVTEEVTWAHNMRWSYESSGPKIFKVPCEEVTRKVVQGWWWLFLFGGGRDSSLRSILTPKSN